MNHNPRPSLVACPWCSALVKPTEPDQCPHCGHDLYLPPALCPCDTCIKAQPLLDNALAQPDPADFALVIGCSVYQIRNGLDHYGYGTKGATKLRPWHPLNSRRHDTPPNTPDYTLPILPYVRP